jgi:hypothetical protein
MRWDLDTGYEIREEMPEAVACPVGRRLAAEVQSCAENFALTLPIQQFRYLLFMKCDSM